MDGSKQPEIILPNEILDKIFTPSLDSLTLRRCSQVCRQWNQCTTQLISQHPLLLPKVLRRIFKCLFYLHDILNCRLVCHLWNHGVSALLRNSELIPKVVTSIVPWWRKEYGSEQTLGALKRIREISSAPSNPFVSGAAQLHIFCFPVDFWILSKIKALCDLVRLHGEWIRFLKIHLSTNDIRSDEKMDCSCYVIGIKFVISCIQTLPSLEELEVHTLFTTCMCDNHCCLKTLGKAQGEIAKLTRELWASGSSTLPILRRVVIHVNFQKFNNFSYLPELLNSVLELCIGLRKLEIGHWTLENQKRSQFSCFQILDMVAAHNLPLLRELTLINLQWVMKTNKKTWDESTTANYEKLFGKLGSFKMMENEGWNTCCRHQPFYIGYPILSLI